MLTPRTALAQVADELLEAWWCCKRVFGDHIQQSRRPPLEPGCRESPGAVLGLAHDPANPGPDAKYDSLLDRPPVVLTNRHRVAALDCDRLTLPR
jgi:hypothetical protein